MAPRPAWGSAALPERREERKRHDDGRQQALLADGARAAITREFDEALAGFDALLTPATRTAAPVDADIDQSTTAAILTRPINLIDYCALVLPNGMTAGGLPISLQIACCGCEEATALGTGRALWKATDWHTRAPSGLDAQLVR